MKKPTLQEVREYIKAEGFYDVNPEKFWNYYEMVGWVVGKSRKPMKQWRSAVVTWTHTTALSRKLHKFGKCACGCGCKPVLLIDGKGYAYERCLERVKPKQMNLELARNILKDVPDKPKREIWKELKQL